MKSKTRRGERFGILALAGALAIIGCSKKVENQQGAAESSKAVAQTVAAALGSGGSTGAAPALMAHAVGMSLTPAGYTKPTWDGSFYVFPAQSHDNGSWTMKMQFQDANGQSLGDVLNKSTSTTIGGQTVTTPDDSWKASWKKTRMIASGTNADGMASNMDMTMTMDVTTTGTQGSAGYSSTVKMTMNGSGTHKDPKKKVDMAMTMTNMTFTSTISGTTYTTKGPDGTVTFSGTVSEKPVSGSLTFADGVGDGTMTVADDTITIHVEKNGTGSWKDSKGEKHDLSS